MLKNRVFPALLAMPGRKRASNQCIIDIAGSAEFYWFGCVNNYVCCVWGVVGGGVNCGCVCGGFGVGVDICGWRCLLCLCR